MTIDFMKSLGRKVGVAGLCLTVVLAGCDVVAVQNDPTDQCNDVRQKIAAARNTEINERVENGAGAALAAGLLTAINGGSADEVRRNVLISGLSGFALTYFNQKRQQNRDNNALLASVNRDASNERRLVSQTGKRAQDLRTCRQNQIAALSREARRGEINAATARSRLNVLKQRIAADNRLISSAFGGIDQRVDAYISATAASAQVDRSLITRERQVNASAAQRRAAANARNRTPQVTSAAQETNRQKTNDTRRAAAVDRDIRALEALLS